MIHVKEVNRLYEAESGCTCPALVTLDNGKRAVYKYPNNPQGMIVLFNEFFSCSIADRLGVTGPRFGIAYSDEYTHMDIKGIDKELSYFFGKGFYSEYLGNR